MSGEDDFGYGPLASNPFYTQINRRLVALTRLLPGQCVVDLGAGTGKFAEKAQVFGFDVRVNDISTFAEKALKKKGLRG